MEHKSVDGLVLRVGACGGQSRYLSVLTASEGRISMICHGNRSVKGGQNAVCQPLVYGNFEYFTQGESRIFKRGSVTHSFYRLTEDLVGMGLAAYLCEVAAELSDEGEDATDLLRLLLNSLFALDERRYPPAQIKGAFEFRVAAASGYEPDLSGCALCRKRDFIRRDEAVYLDVMNGALFCGDCFRKRAAPTAPRDADDARDADIVCPLTAGAVAAIRYCLSAPLNRLFAFSLPDGEDDRLFSAAAQTYLLSHTERHFESLNFYTDVVKMSQDQSTPTDADGRR